MAAPARVVLGGWLGLAMSPRTKSILRMAVSSLALACVAFFFYRAFQQNWESVRAQRFALIPGPLLCAFGCFLATYLVPAYGWQITLNSLSGRRPLSFVETVAVVNSSGLTKYIPGKIWSYALQVFWLSSLGYSKALIVYVNAINMAISLGTAFIVGLALLLPRGDLLPTPIVAGALVSLVVLDIVAIKFHDFLLHWLIDLNNRYSKRKLQYFSLSTGLMLKLHLIHAFAAVVFGVAAHFVALGIGSSVSFSQALVLMAALLLGDTIAFVAVVVPGGLGIREGIMYSMIDGANLGALALTVPIASRVVHMAVDLLLGTVALVLLRRWSKSVAQAARPDTVAELADDEPT